GETRRRRADCPWRRTPSTRAGSRSPPARGRTSRPCPSAGRRPIARPRRARRHWPRRHSAAADRWHRDRRPRRAAPGLAPPRRASPAPSARPSARASIDSPILPPFQRFAGCETSTAALTDSAPAPLRPGTVGPIEAALMNIAQKSTFVINQRDLLGIEGLSREEILGLLDLAEHFVDLNRQIDKKQVSLRGRTLINLFFEVSTRTQASFELAGKRLGADVMNMSVGSSSMRKGETLIDTAITLNAMHPDIIVVRHHASGAVELLARKVDCSVINAGDGSHEHPTQALLDALTIRRNKGRIERLVVAICGDILHSRVARSNI